MRFPHDETLGFPSNRRHPERVSGSNSRRVTAAFVALTQIQGDGGVSVGGLDR